MSISFGRINPGRKAMRRRCEKSNDAEKRQGGGSRGSEYPMFRENDSHSGPPRKARDERAAIFKLRPVNAAKT